MCIFRYMCICIYTYSYFTILYIVLVVLLVLVLVASVVVGVILIIIVSHCSSCLLFRSTNSSNSSIKLWEGGKERKNKY